MGLGTRSRQARTAAGRRRDIFLRSAFEYSSNNELIRRSTVGAYIAGSEIAVVFFAEDTTETGGSLAHEVRPGD
jgi:hypothetical protein